MGLLRLVIWTVLTCAVLAATPAPTKSLKGSTHKAVIKPSNQSVVAAKPVAGTISVAAAAKSEVAAPAATTGSNQTNGHVTSTPQKQLLRLCNAHPAGDLEVFLDSGDTGHLALFGGGQAIPHRQCRETTQLMRVGDYLEFRVLGVHKKAFVPAAPVRDNTVAMHVIYQNEKDAVGVYLHYFDHLTHPQIVAVDVSPSTTSKRPSPVAADLKCDGGECANEKLKKLEYGHVVPIYPGQYDIALSGKHFDLDAAMGESYAVLRLGDGDVVIYPPSQGGFTKSAANSAVASLLLLAVSAMQFV